VRVSRDPFPSKRAVDSKKYLFTEVFFVCIWRR